MSVKKQPLARYRWVIGFGVALLAAWSALMVDIIGNREQNPAPAVAFNVLVTVAIVSAAYGIVVLFQRRSKRH